MFKRFVAEREDQPGAAWLARFAAGREETERWYLGKGLADPPTTAECRGALREHMRELLPHYDRVCALVGDDDLAHRNFEPLSAAADDQRLHAGGLAG